MSSRKILHVAIHMLTILTIFNRGVKTNKPKFPPCQRNLVDENVDSLKHWHI